jgi:hypothetical protein
MKPKIYIKGKPKITRRGSCSDEISYTNMVISDESEGRITLTHAMTADELKTAFAALPPMEPVEPGHNWAFSCWDLRQNVANNDPAEFLTWPGVVATMFVGNAPYIDYEVDELLSDEVRRAIVEPQIGNPIMYDRYLQLVELGTSGNLIHQAYHISQWDGWLPELETIVEIGGGYGAMALICHRLGFRGRYIIYDLPEFSLLQQYYLSNVGIDGVEFSTEIYNFYLDQVEADLLIGLYSLSEMPLDARETIIDLCPAQSYLIAYGASWGGWDNMKWAMELMKLKKGYTWRNWNIPHLPNCWYLVGDKRDD